MRSKSILENYLSREVRRQLHEAKGSPSINGAYQKVINKFDEVTEDMEQSDYHTVGQHLFKYFEKFKKNYK